MIVATVVIAWAVGTRLPREHVATVAATFVASPDSVWAVLDDPYGAASWRRDVLRVERLPDRDGMPSWREEAGFGIVTYVLVRSIPRASRTVRIVDEDLPYGGEWDYVVEPSGSGTRVALTERGFVEPALFRFLARYVFGYTSTMNDYLVALGARFGESASPEVVLDGR